MYDFFNRHGWVALVLIAASLGFIAFALLEDAPNRPELLPRVLTGAAVGTLPVAALAALAWFRPQLRMFAWSAFALLVGATIVTVWVIAVSSQEFPKPLETPGLVETLGGFSAILAWGAIAAAAVATWAGLRHARGMRHAGYVTRYPEGYAAECDCGWRGETRADSSDAFDDAGDHANRVALTIRTP